MLCQIVVLGFPYDETTVSLPYLHDDLAAVVRGALLPQPFPFRRDVELGACAEHAAGSVSFYDSVWLGQQTLAVASVRLRKGGVEGALAAASFKQLLRAALALRDDLTAVLSECRQIFRSADFDAAIMKLDTVTGSMTAAAAGQACVHVIGKGGGKDIRLSRGDIVWIAAGEFPPPATAEVPVAGLDQFVRPVIERAGQGCAAALLFNAYARAANTGTFVVPNDSAAIPELLGQIEAFFSRHAIASEDVVGIDVAIDEVLTNAISYAFKDGDAHEIVVALTAEEKRLTIEIRDDGVPFDPLDLPPPDLCDDIDLRKIGGLGMHFVRTLLDEVSYQRLNGWNVLTLRKHLARAIRPEETES